jgi:hypothetical protein
VFYRENLYNYLFEVILFVFIYSCVQWNHDVVLFLIRMPDSLGNAPIVTIIYL